MVVGSSFLLVTSLLLACWWQQLVSCGSLLVVVAYWHQQVFDCVDHFCCWHGWLVVVVGLLVSVAVCWYWL